MIEDAKTAKEAASQCLEVMTFIGSDETVWAFVRQLRATALGEECDVHSEADDRFSNRTIRLARRTWNMKPGDRVRTIAVMDEIHALVFRSNDPKRLVTNALQAIEDGRGRRADRLATLILSLSNRKIFDAVAAVTPGTVVQTRLEEEAKRQ